MSTNFAKTLVWKHEYDVKLWRHKQRTPNTNDHSMPLNELPPMKIFCVRHCLPIVQTRIRLNYGNRMKPHDCSLQSLKAMDLKPKPETSGLRPSLEIPSLITTKKYLIGKTWRPFFPSMSTSRIFIKRKYNC